MNARKKCFLVKYIVVSEQRDPYFKINIDFTDDIDINRVFKHYWRDSTFFPYGIPKVREEPDLDSECHQKKSSDNYSIYSDKEYVPPRRRKHVARDWQL